MKLTKGYWIILFISICYIAGFAFYYWYIQDFEFIWYVLVLVFFGLLIGLTLKKSELPLWLVFLLSAWGFLHMAGGGIRIGDHVLYAQVLIPFIQQGEWHILKYDQVIHAFGFGVTAIVLYFLIAKKVGRLISPFWLGVISVCAATGLGALNEIVEFIAVVAVPETGVGGYINTSLDLVSNLIGAIFATFLYVKLRNRKKIDF